MTPEVLQNPASFDKEEGHERGRGGASRRRCPETRQDTPPQGGPHNAWECILGAKNAQAWVSLTMRLDREPSARKMIGEVAIDC